MLDSRIFSESEHPAFSKNLDNCIGESGKKASHGCQIQSNDCVRSYLAFLRDCWQGSGDS